MTMLSFRIIADTYATMRAAALTDAATFYGVDPDDPRLILTFHGAVSYLAPAALAEVGDYPDGIPPHGDRWCGRWDATLVADPPPSPIHAAHPSIHRLVIRNDGHRVAEVNVGGIAAGYTEAVTACGAPLIDGNYRPLTGTPKPQWADAATKAGVTCMGCIHPADHASIEIRPEP